MRCTTTTKGSFDLSAYSWANPAVVRQRAEQNYARMVINLKQHHAKEDWDNVRCEAELRRQIFTDALAIMHGRTVYEAVKVFQSGIIKPLAAFKSIGANPNTRKLDVDLDLDNYAFFGFCRVGTLANVLFVFSTHLLNHPDFFVTAEDLSAYTDLDSYEEMLVGLRKEVHPLSVSPKLKEELDKYTKSIIPGDKYINLLSLLSVLEFYTFEDSIKMLLRGNTHYGNPGEKTQGIKCNCHSDKFSGEHFYCAEGKIFGGTNLSLLQEILVDHPSTKEELISCGLPADLIVVLRDFCDSYEERFRLRITNFAEATSPKIHGMMPWINIPS